LPCVSGDGCGVCPAAIFSPFFVLGWKNALRHDRCTSLMVVFGAQKHSTPLIYRDQRGFYGL
jgi:hypothetical protein